MQWVGSDMLRINPYLIIQPTASLCAAVLRSYFVFRLGNLTRKRCFACLGATSGTQSLDHSIMESDWDNRPAASLFVFLKLVWHGVLLQAADPSLLGSIDETCIGCSFCSPHISY
jgi:hypothetical protein